VNGMKSPFAFEGQIRPLPYALGSAGVFFSQHLAVAALFGVLHRDLGVNWRFWLYPLRSVAELNHASPVTAAFAFAFALLVAWGLASLAFRRSMNAGGSGWVAAVVIVPIIQILAIVALAVTPARTVAASQPNDVPGGKRSMDWRTAIQGMLAGAGLTVFTVAVGALIFGAYGYGMFVVGPFLIGATTAYLANRKGDIGGVNTAGLVLCATALGGMALVAVALEGIICIILAAPLAVAVALPGGALGRSVALSGQRRANRSLMNVAFLPIVFLSEQAFPPSKVVDMSQSIDVAAPADAVWRSLIHMDSIDSAPTLPFQLGVAYPVSAQIIGEGVGAKRVGVFSTGEAVERVTEWEPGRKLSFVVLSDPPALRELSPYKHVHAPHVVGYFHTITTSFALLPLPGGRTRVVLRSTHELKLDPVLYWLPLTRWVVSEDDGRVLAYVRRRSEASQHSSPTVMVARPSVRLAARHLS
jgi:hypothetical protein